VGTFEFVFSLFGLLLGLSLAEVLGGFGWAVRHRHRVKLGWLTPLLGSVVMLDLTAFWLLAWSVRDHLHAGYDTLVVGLFVTGLYYLAASMIFPREEFVGQSLDQHFFAVRAKVLGALLVCNLSAYLAAWSHTGMTFFSPPQLARMALFGSMVLVAIFVRGPRMVAAVLALICAMYLSAAATH
jgi:hypothetical protein